MPSRVLVNVYDLGDFNGYISWLGIGVFHSGVQVYDREYAFGAHMYECSGVFSTEPMQAPGEGNFKTFKIFIVKLASPRSSYRSEHTQVVYKGQIDMGETMFDEDEVEGKVREMGERYQGIVYHLLQMNCNHFCSDFCYELVGKRPPPWINRLADLMVSVHCLFPPNWLPPLKPPMVDPTTTEGGCREATGVNYITHKRSARAERYRTNLDDGATEPLTGLHGGAMTPSLLGVTEPLAGLHGGAMTPSMLGASSALCADRTASADDVEVSLSEMNDKAGRTS